MNLHVVYLRGLLDLLVVVAQWGDRSRIGFSVGFVYDSWLIVGVTNVRGACSYWGNRSALDPTDVIVDILGHILVVHFAARVVVQKSVSGARKPFDYVVLVTLGTIEHVLVQ